MLPPPVPSQRRFVHEPSLRDTHTVAQPLPPQPNVILGDGQKDQLELLMWDSPLSALTVTVVDGMSGPHPVWKEKVP